MRSLTKFWKNCVECECEAIKITAALTHLLHYLATLFMLLTKLLACCVIAPERKIFCYLFISS